MAASAEDDGKEARCVATVAGLPANTTLASIVVNCTFLHCRATLPIKTRHFRSELLSIVVLSVVATTFKTSSRLTILMNSQPGHWVHTALSCLCIVLENK